MPDTLVALYVFVLACFIGYLGGNPFTAYSTGCTDECHLWHYHRWRATGHGFGRGQYNGPNHGLFRRITGIDQCFWWLSGDQSHARHV